MDFKELEKAILKAKELNGKNGMKNDVNIITDILIAKINELENRIIELENDKKFPL